MSTLPPPQQPAPAPATSSGAPLLRRIASFTRRRSRDGSLDLSSALPVLEHRLTEKTDLIDDLKKVVPLDVEAPGIIALGGPGSGKSTVLEAITSVPIPRSHAAAGAAALEGSAYGGAAAAPRRVLRMKVTCDPTVSREFAMVSLVDPNCKDEGARRLDKMEELPKVLSALLQQPAYIAEEEEEGEEYDYDEEGNAVPRHAAAAAAGRTGGLETIYVRVLRPSGPTYTVVELPGLPEEDGAEPGYEEQLRAVLRQHPNFLLLALVPVPDLFDRARSVRMAKEVDPESKRTIGVVTKMDLVEKDMDVVEKLQMTSRKDAVLPLGYVAIMARDRRRYLSWDDLIEAERGFFRGNALLRGLKPERWGIPTLKSLVVEFQINAISQRIPEMTVKVRSEMEQLEREAKELDAGGERNTQLTTTETGSKRASFTAATFSTTSDFFTRLCAETTALAFDIAELANGSVTRLDRRFNLGPRFLVSLELREAQARRILPSFQSSDSEGWLVKELGEFRGVTSSNDSMMHPIFRKAVREVCFPVLAAYAKSIRDDADYILKEVTSLLIDERFGGYPRLAEALKRDVANVQAKKRADAEAFIDRLLESELNWIFVSEKDLRLLQREVEAGLSGGAVPTLQDDWPMISEVALAGPDTGDEDDPTSSSSRPRPPNPVMAGGGKLRPAADGATAPQSRELRAMQLSLDAYVRLLLRRLFYAIPMNVKNIVMGEFRRDLVSLVAQNYNLEDKLRSLMSEELWVNNKRKQTQERLRALEGVLQKLDKLS